MKVGDLIRYKAFPETGHGVVLEVEEHMVLFYFIDNCPDYIWDFKDHMEVVTCE